MCGYTGTVAITETPKDSKVPIMVTLENSEEIIDFVVYCAEHYVRPE